MSGPLLSEVIPELASELVTLLEEYGEPQLAEQVAGLRIVGRCRCGDDSCATFYTAPKPKGAWGAGHGNIRLDPDRGYLILDLVDRKIVCVEVLDRDEYRTKLLEVLP
jgi:hypothetical protein